ncbi:hypothetical protein KIW84_022153 [Lathyrus oleraceus]|uniref:Uncharacterized protein n=1 Tax=Pisum sativum TaxID=3888 RepID=A0A9D4YEB2_PEA|nr:hypothetical protein KIW84_022153 [Pisum sativum]
MPAGFPWGMPPGFMPDIPAPTFASMPASSPVIVIPPPVVHTIPRVDDTIYHSEPSEGPYFHKKMDAMNDQFLEIRKELKTLRGKDLFGKSTAELCLVPGVKIPVKFKVPDFEKYKGNTCPLSHLVMYARKMSTQTDNDQLLIHYFQDSLSGAALRCINTTWIWLPIGICSEPCPRRTKRHLKSTPRGGESWQLRLLLRWKRRR